MNKTKKAVLIAVACVSAVMGAWGLAACNTTPNTPAEPKHTHDYTYTSNNDGTHNGTCKDKDGKCDKKTVTNETCDTNGKDGVDGACSRCGYKEEEEIKPTTVTLGTDKTIASLDTTGLTLTLEGMEAGTSYTLSCTNDKVKFCVGDEQGNPVSFVYSPMMMRNVTVNSTEGTLTNVVIKLEETTEPEFTAISLNDEVTVEGADEYEPVKYEIELAQGQYQIFIDGEAITLDMAALVGIGIYVEGQFEYLNNIDDITVEVGDGTYYIEAYDNVTFKVAVASVHTHIWSWEVAEDDKPDATKTGTATRTCSGTVGTCGWEASDLTAELPKLDEEDEGYANYTIGKDTATCEAAGTQSYSITIDGKVATFEVETPQKTPDVQEVAAISGGTAENLTLPSGGTLGLSSYKHYECKSCGKKFKENCHEADCEIDLATWANPSSIGQAFGPFTSVGEHHVVGRNGNGIMYKAEEDGYYKISLEIATSVKSVAYFGSNQEGTTPSVVLNNKVWQKNAAEFERLVHTVESPVKEVYVRMNAGDIVAVTFVYSTPSKGSATFNVEKVDEEDLPLCQLHVGGYDFSEISTDGGTVNKKCKFCGVDLGEPLAYDKGATVTADNESAPVAVVDGVTLVKTNVADGTYISFTPAAAGKYELKLEALTDNALSVAKVLCGEANAAVEISGSLYFNAPYSDFIKLTKANGVVSLVIDVNGEYIGQTFTVSVKTAGASAETPAAFVAKSSTLKELSYGQNTVVITEANAQFVDEYSFMPTATRKYSMTVPEGVEVIMNDQDLIYGEDRTVNFDATQGVKIVFAFKYTAAEAITVTIGDEILELKQLTLASPTTVTMEGQTVFGFELGEDIEVGKTYKITFTGGFTTGRQTGFGTWWFKINGSTSYDSFSSDTATSFYGGTANGTTTVGDRSWDYKLSSAEQSVTFTAQEGDIIYVAIQTSYIPKGSKLGDLIMTVTEVVEEA